MHLSASTLKGNDVTNLNDENLGTIEDFMLDTSTAKVDYAVVSFGGVLGIGDKLFAIPMQALKLDADNKQFILDADKESLKNAPGFEKDHWPNTADPSWRSSVNSYYKI